ncbi:MAG: iron-containing alcohol dehydrogenase [Chitinivibrionales bacterium]|nr:iron-containing alcohol dehydrogenase [Chitinivibrionales bacterium]MBD3395458.1 iron-containing alcohol dehydrogenase [Chitinivibrionales bacterium]
MSATSTPPPYGQTIACECGKTHNIDPRIVVYSADAIGRIPALAGRFGRGMRVAVLMDARTEKVAGREICATLAGSGREIVEVRVADPAPGESPVCDSETFAGVKEQCADAGLILPVGSGVLSDLGKWCACELDIPYICFATAASMNGYSSANVAAAVKGVKTVVRAMPPKAVLSSPSVICNAPSEMTVSGLGDVLAKSVSSADWRINHVMFGDYYCARANSLIAAIEPLVMDHPGRLRDHQSDAMEALFEALLLTGAAMTMAETSAPASGGEHLISHALDMMSMVDGSAHGMHGAQVGVGTILASELYRRIMALEHPVLRKTLLNVDRAFWGELGGEVENQYVQKTARLEQARELIGRQDMWNRIREEARVFLRAPEVIQRCLREAGGAYRAEHIGCTRDRLRRALLHAHEIRSRFTVLDLAYLTGVLPDAAGEVVEEWA